MLTPRVALFVLVLAAGCKERNPNYCADEPDNLCTDGGTDTPESCSASDPCIYGECKLPEGVCVECLDSSHCEGAAPVCNTETNACRKCTAHADCASNACLPTGECGSDANVAYLAPQAGTDNTTCTLASKCTVFSKAIDTGRPYIKLEGTYNDGIVIDNTNVTILAEQSPRARFSRASGTIIEVKGSSTVTIYDAEIDGGGNATIGVSIPAGATPTTLTLDRVKVSSNDGGGILVASGTLSLVNSRISDNQGGGVAVSGPTTKYTIVNNFIIYNGKGTGSPVSQLGGVNLGPNLPTNKFEFNTVAFNASDGGDSGGAECNG
nr:right-handed parallel beta-helix repeat-containing protein [Deltaproteobacteria bacterium]